MNLKSFAKELVREKKILTQKLETVERIYAALMGKGKHALATKAKQRNKMSAKGRRAIAAAQRARWAKIKAGKK